MLYNVLKILHIFLASLLVFSMAQCVLARKIAHTQTFLVIIPVAILQLMTGFTIISIKHYTASDLWIRGSTIGFMILISSWITYLFASAYPHKYLKQGSLAICFGTLLTMVFLMANKIA